MDGVGLGVTGVLVGMGKGVLVIVGLAAGVVTGGVGVSRGGGMVQVGNGVQVAGCSSCSSPGNIAASTTLIFKSGRWVGTSVGSSSFPVAQPANKTMFNTSNTHNTPGTNLRRYWLVIDLVFCILQLF